MALVERLLHGVQRAIGLGQAYYVTVSGDRAGVGSPGDDGWTWTANDALAPDVQMAIKVLKSEEKPTYVSLPAAVQK